MPIHRLNEPPTRRAVLGDITCDSDGKIDQFIDLRDVQNTLELHPFNGEPYYLGAFLLGAYQEILGDLHNLFGDTNAVHVSLDETALRLDEVIKGDTVREVLHYVQYSADEADDAVRKDVERAVRGGRFRSRNPGNSSLLRVGLEAIPIWKSREHDRGCAMESRSRSRIAGCSHSSGHGVARAFAGAWLDRRRHPGTTCKSSFHPSG